MRRALPHLAALLLGAAAAVTIGCGDRSNLVPGDAASAMDGRLAAAKTAIAAGRCDDARTAIAAGFDDAKALSSDVDRRLRSRINDGFRQLQKTYGQACAAAKTQTETTGTDTTTTQTKTTDATTTETGTTPADTTTTPTDTQPSHATPPSTGTPGSTATPAGPNAPATGGEVTP